jgi:glucose-6-phosphate dehydrogenase assembly protein OpcA
MVVLLQTVKKVSGYSSGGIARGSRQGYPAILHGTEAVVPLPNGKSIPVEMKSSGNQQNIVNVSVSSDGQMQSTQVSGEDRMEELGKAVAAAVQKELHNQKRSGGILSPVGAA